jgi:hypothetical protein
MPKPEVVSSFRRNSFHGLEDATQSWEYKDILTLDVSSGEVRQAGNDDQRILGFAQADASGTTGEDAVVHEIFPGDIIALDIWSEHDGALVDASTLVDGQVCNLYTAGGEWYAETTLVSGVDAATSCIFDAVAFIKSQGNLRDEQYGNTVYRGIFRVLEAVCVTVNGAAAVST